MRQVLEDPGSGLMLGAVGIAAVAPQLAGAGDEPKKTGAQAPAPKKQVVVLATGGTIAGVRQRSGYGYTSGEFKVEDLIKAVPNLDKLAKLSGEQVANIGSQDMNDEVWLKLANRVNAALARPEVTASSSRTAPTRWRRPPTSSISSSRATSRSCSSARCARPPPSAPTARRTSTTPWRRRRAPRRKGRGVLVVLNDKIHDARNVAKTNTTNVETFESPNRGPVGLVNSGSVTWFERMDKKHTTKTRVLGRGHASSCLASTSCTRTPTWTRRSIRASLQTARRASSSPVSATAT